MSDNGHHSAADMRAAAPDMIDKLTKRIAELEQLLDASRYELNTAKKDLFFWRGVDRMNPKPKARA